jgi:hypothetical protein
MSSEMQFRSLQGSFLRFLSFTDIPGYEGGYDRSSGGSGGGGGYSGGGGDRY